MRVVWDPRASSNKRPAGSVMDAEESNYHKTRVILKLKCWISSFFFFFFRINERDRVRLLRAGVVQFFLRERKIFHLPSIQEERNKYEVEKLLAFRFIPEDNSMIGNFFEKIFKRIVSQIN